MCELRRWDVFDVWIVILCLMRGREIPDDGRGVGMCGLQHGHLLGGGRVQVAERLRGVPSGLDHHGIGVERLLGLRPGLVHRDDGRHGVRLVRPRRVLRGGRQRLHELRDGVLCDRRRRVELLGLPRGHLLPRPWRFAVDHVREQLRRGVLLWRGGERVHGLLGRDLRGRDRLIGLHFVRGGLDLRRRGHGMLELPARAEQ